MADTKISALTAATTPLAGTEVLPIVQSGTTKKVSVANLTAGRSTAMSELLVNTASVLASAKGSIYQGSLFLLGDGLAIQDGNALTGGYYISFLDQSGNKIGKIERNGASTVNYATSSDAKLKKDIVDAPEASSEIDNIRIRSFVWKADDTFQKFGVIAQELETVVPEAVTKARGEDDAMGVDYSKLVPLLVKEIQSLRQRVAALESTK